MGKQEILVCGQRAFLSGLLRKSWGHAADPAELCVCLSGVGGPFSLRAEKTADPSGARQLSPSAGPHPGPPARKVGEVPSQPPQTRRRGGLAWGRVHVGPMSMWAGHHQGCLPRRDWPREGPVGGRPHPASSTPVPSLSQGPEVASSPRPRGPGCKAAAPVCRAPGRTFAPLTVSA